MAGHSKWANIKHRKSRQDAKRAKVWTKVIRELTVASRLGGPNVNDNPRLRAAVDGALAVNMPKDTIDRAIARGSGDGDEGHVEEVVYEGYANGGVAILVETITDNRNRTVAEVRHTFSKYGGNLGTSGSVAYLFEQRGVIQFEEGVDEDAIIEVALDTGADDVEVDESGSIAVLTSPADFPLVLERFRTLEYEPAVSALMMLPGTSIACDKEKSERVNALIEALDDLDDVQNVYSNGEFSI